MSPVDHLQRLHRYDYWANGLTIESLRDVDDSGYSLRVFGHILNAQEVWLKRLRCEDSSRVAIWDQSQYDECEERLERLAGAISQHLDDLTNDDMDERLAYTNQWGESFESTRFDILVHLFTHSHYHRGQIAASVRHTGGKPAATDFIFAVRSHGI
jgi:uncharacterized damage-inducible protein DinB